MKVPLSTLSVSVVALIGYHLPFSEALVVPSLFQQQKHAASIPAASLLLASSPTGTTGSIIKPQNQRKVLGKKQTFKLQAQASSSNASNDNVELNKNVKSIMSASIFIVFDIIFRRALKKAAISFPSSLAGCGALFAAMLVLPQGEAIFQQLKPGADLLAKWLPVFFVPSLVTLPLAHSMGPASEILKLGIVIVGGFCFTLLSTAGSVVGVRKLFTKEKEAETNESAAEFVAAAKETAANVRDAVEASMPPPKPFSDELTFRLRALTIASGLGALGTTLIGSASPILNTVFMLSTTLYAFVFGARQPKSFTKIIHPLVTCTAMTWTIATLFATLTKSTFKQMLKSYKIGSLKFGAAGAGDLLLFLLGPAVVSLAISMYDRRKLMQENIVEVGTAVGVSSLGGLFGTAYMVKLLQILSPSMRLSLLSRNITSPLAMAIASILGADVSIAVSMVVVTGLIGASTGASLLNSFGIKDPVARGLGIGAAAHGIGTASFVNEKDAFPFAAIAMALTASACTVLVSVPLVQRLLMQIALG